ncbi:hypothetical protein E5Q_04799 [Mixia osmundae IAM 14324]|uniref:RIC1 C-terminal alpha solenoid region domain-containing protein n=1 Tax=Mixia osmundae (strain CBS 9802 / IAM 14324 / JCM 22182 / KY 12970) TaxID=764103 RepID=G7E5K6_MIXOS|nr:hypothetical protein E5Q_04799 [Mixia osmundae IAM 14324]
MYFPTLLTKQLRPSLGSTTDDEPPLPSSLASLARLGGAREEQLLSLAEDATGEHFVAIGHSELAIWSVRPCVLLTKVKRSPKSVREHGTFVRAIWHDYVQNDTQRRRIVLAQTTGSVLMAYAVMPSLPSSAVYQMPGRSSRKVQQFQPGPGEGYPLTSISLRPLGQINLSQEPIACFCGTPDGLLVATSNPAAVRLVPWTAFALRIATANGTPSPSIVDQGVSTPQTDLSWLESDSGYIVNLAYHSTIDAVTMITSSGSVYCTRARANVPASEPAPALSVAAWEGVCIYRPQSSASGQSIGSPSLLHTSVYQDDLGAKAAAQAYNDRFSLLAVGLDDGCCQIYSLAQDAAVPVLSHRLSLRAALRSTASHLNCDSVTAMSWTRDGHALAVGLLRGWSVWSVFGRLACWAGNGQASGAVEENDSSSFSDAFFNGIDALFWNAADSELFVLAKPRQVEGSACKAIDTQLFAIPFAKSAVATLHSPDNCQHALLQLDDRVMIYRGQDQPDMSVINPESDVWQYIKVPSEYIAGNWPIRSSCVSSDGRLLAVAGRRGFVHYNTLSGRWKLFDNEAEEQAFQVTGGMVWYENVLVVGAEENDAHYIRLYARDRPLSRNYVLHQDAFPSPILLISILESSLLIYTEDNTFYHMLLVPGRNGYRTRMCGSIGFEGIVTDPAKVRGMSWIIPRAQHRFGDPSTDLDVATIVFLVDGSLVLLKPSRIGEEVVKYDMQILADRIEYYWTHPSGVGALEGSLWAYNGQEVRVWLNIVTRSSGGSESIQNDSLSIPLDFYPLSVLMDKGVIIGVDQETGIRKNLDFAIFRLVTTTHLFLHHVLRHHLSRRQIGKGIEFATHYADLVYFAHALEVLLHSVLEDEADALALDRRSPDMAPALPRDSVLQSVIEFLDYFPQALQVVVGCARKTEVARWEYLFDAAGSPADLFERCIENDALKLAASYLLVLHALEPADATDGYTVKLIRVALTAQDWELVKELYRFLYSLDRSGNRLRNALAAAGALPPGVRAPSPAVHRKSVSEPPLLSPVTQLIGGGSTGRYRPPQAPESPLQAKSAHKTPPPSTPPIEVKPVQPSFSLGSLFSKLVSIEPGTADVVKSSTG